MSLTCTQKVCREEVKFLEPESDQTISDGKDLQTNKEHNRFFADISKFYISIYRSSIFRYIEISIFQYIGTLISISDIPHEYIGTRYISHRRRGGYLVEWGESGEVEFRYLIHKNFRHVTCRALIL